MINENQNTLLHYGVGHDKGGHSGRYPWGSGAPKDIRAIYNSDGSLSVAGKKYLQSLSDKKHYNQARLGIYGISIAAGAVSALLAGVNPVLAKGVSTGAVFSSATLLTKLRTEKNGAEERLKLEEVLNTYETLGKRAGEKLFNQLFKTNVSDSKLYGENWLDKFVDAHKKDIESYTLLNDLEKIGSSKYNPLYFKNNTLKDSLLYKKTLEKFLPPKMEDYIDKDLIAIGTDFDKNNLTYTSIAGVHCSLKYNYNSLRDLADYAWFYSYEDGDQGYDNSACVYAALNPNKIKDIDTCIKYHDSEAKNKYEEAIYASAENATFSVLQLMQDKDREKVSFTDANNLGKKGYNFVTEYIRNHPEGNRDTEGSLGAFSYLLDEGIRWDKSTLSPGNTKAIKQSEKIAKDTGILKVNGNFNVYFKALDNLNYSDKKYDELSKSELKKLNDEIDKLLKKEG